MNRKDFLSSLVESQSELPVCRSRELRIPISTYPADMVWLLDNCGREFLEGSNENIPTRLILGMIRGVIEQPIFFTHKIREGGIASVRVHLSRFGARELDVKPALSHSDCFTGDEDGRVFVTRFI